MAFSTKNNFLIIIIKKDINNYFKLKIWSFNLDIHNHRLDKDTMIIFLTNTISFYFKERKAKNTSINMESDMYLKIKLINWNKEKNIIHNMWPNKLSLVLWKEHIMLALMKCSSKKCLIKHLKETLNNSNSHMKEAKS